MSLEARAPFRPERGMQHAAHERALLQLAVFLRQFSTLSMRFHYFEYLDRLDLAALR